jgi:hypothetical protein
MIKMIPFSLFLLLCASSFVPQPQLSCLRNPSAFITPQLPRLNHHASTFMPLRSRLYDPAPTIVSVLSCRKFNVEREHDPPRKVQFKGNMTRLEKFNLTFEEVMEIEVNLRRLAEAWVDF